MALRCFVSIELPESVKNSLSEVIRELSSSGADVKWVRPENLHITLKFIGPTPEERVSEITGKLSEAVSGRRIFGVEFKGIGAFPSPKRPRVVWIGISDSGGLSALQRDVEAVLVSIGFDPEERPFSPHLTIGRFRSPKGAIRLMSEARKFEDSVFGRVEVSRVSLMKSELRPGGAEYSELASLALLPVMTVPGGLG